MRLLNLVALAAFVLPGCASVQERPVAAPPTAPDTLVAAQIPQIPEGLRPVIQADYDASPRTAYTLVVGSAGRGWASHSGRGSWSASERTRVALQRCEHYAQGPCILVMANGRLTGRTAPEPRALTYPTRFDATAVPFLNDAQKAELGARYPTARQHRAIAIWRLGGFAWVVGRPSAAEAQRDALQNCQRFGDGNRPCFLYSVDDQVVFTPQTDISDAIRPRP
ncbi:DUF4189 domain-containing protein [Falsiroseomonas selenitidurans]|uniref:DUF4189 domain-containing protein n=1 Tax=Falsiroseomonas selenitidurans TaxID=2716335 RepID=A0ABX1DYA3_9PROT|nr:DUF4189 domain-containing protein [Falsiroseomonas selenitidurans]NKC29861.1 DUF4189 domain-containing protein [Falsiroseomonas selenitidurans]